MYSLKYKVTTSTCDSEGNLKMYSALQMMQDCSEMWLESEPEVKAYFACENMTQLLASRQVEVLRVPSFKEELTVSTSVYEVKAMFGYRNTFIYDADGRPVQHLQYLPFGQSFVNQHTTGYQERYTFTGKERDEETGYGYFGARYMDYELMTMWLSVDPMADKYPNISPYVYCAWSPIIAIDPNGMDSVYVNRNGSEYKRLPGGNSTFINVNDNWQEVPMPGIIQERTQTHENTTGDEYQKYDYLIAAATGYFNADKNAGELQLYTDGSNPIPRSELAEIPNLDPTLVKAIAIQESNCGRKTTDILQTNNLQDWDPFKSKYGFIKGATPSVWKSLTGGIQILAAKGYKGGISGDGTYSFQGWKSATKAYNGGGNKRYVEFVYEMYQNAVIR